MDRKSIYYNNGSIYEPSDKEAEMMLEVNRLRTIIDESQARVKELVKEYQLLRKTWDCNDGRGVQNAGTIGMALNYMK